jgi:hypothetical protein
MFLQTGIAGLLVCNGYFTDSLFVPDAARGAKPQHAVNKLVIGRIADAAHDMRKLLMPLGRVAANPEWKLIRISNPTGAEFLF